MKIEATRVFERGGVYYANPAQADAGQVVVACVGRKNKSVTLAFVRGVIGANVDVIEGRETVAFESVDGQTYFASAAARADLDDVGVALAALNGAKAK